MTPRDQVREIRRRMRITGTPGNSREAWQIICDVRGNDPHNAWSDWVALSLQSLFQANERRRAPLSAALAYKVLNNFGTTNPFTCIKRSAHERGNRNRQLAARMRARGMLDIEPGNYLALRGQSIHMEY